jgi:hypothetical protein
MAKNKNRNQRRNENPLYRSNPSRPRMRVNFDGQLLNATAFTTPALTVANQATALYLLDTSNVNGIVAAQANALIQGVMKDYTAITTVYNEYVVRSMRFDWIPYVSPGSADAGSQIYIAYLDNPEGITALASSTVATGFATAKLARDSKYFNAWERFSYSVPLGTTRRKSFDTNTNEVVVADTLDRATQGAVIVGYNSISAAVSLGQWKVTFVTELRRLTPGLST